MTRAHALRIARYLISGCTSAAVNIGSLFVLVQAFHMYYLVGSIFAYIVAVLVSFVLQKFWTFEDRATKGVHWQFGLFLMVVVPNLMLNTALVYMLVEWFGLWYLFAQIATGVVIAITGYFGYHYFVFAPASLE